MKKNLFLMLLIFCLATAAIFVAPKADAAFTISTFDSDLEGWSGEGVILNHAETGGNPDGYLLATDRPFTSFITAPPPFLGDLSFFNKGTLSFDIKIFSVNQPPAGSGGNVTLRSDSINVTTNVIDIPSLPVPSPWTHGSIALTAEAWGVDESTWSALLSNVTAIEIVVDPSRSGDPLDISGFDNFRLQAVPIPGALTLVTPCRIVDTRKEGGLIPPGGIRSYNVRGAVVSQGGNPAGCPSPEGEPQGVHVNVTAVPMADSGNIRIFPFGSTPPRSSFVNYKTGVQNIANSGAIKTCFNCTKDISIQSNFGTTHVVIDVLGYYNPEP